MTIIRCSLNRSWIALAAITGLALTTTDASNCEATGSVSPAVADRATSACPAALSDQKQVDEKSMDLNADRRASSAAVQIYTKSYGDLCACPSQPPVGSSSKTGYHIHKGRNGPTATPVRAVSRPRVHFLRVHGGSNLCWGGRLAAGLAKQRLDDPDDDEASDNPNDDDDAYEDLNVYNDSEPSLACLPAPVPYLGAPEFAPSIWVAPPPSTPFSTLQQLRC